VYKIDSFFLLFTGEIRVNAVRIPACCWKPLGSVNQVSKSHFVRLGGGGGFQLAGHDCENTFSLISSLPKGFSFFITVLLKTGKSSLYHVSLRICIIRRCSYGHSFNIYI
jgi:hypothetical protein